MLWLVLACAGDTSSSLPELPPRQEQALLPERGEVRNAVSFAIAWTGEVRGEIEVCGCPTVPYGGFERRATYLDRLRRQGEPLFVLDAGDMLTKGARGDSPDAGLRATTVLGLARQVGVMAWVPSASDVGFAGVREDPTALAVNLPGLVGAKVLEQRGVRLGVVGVAGGTPTAPVDVNAVLASVRAAVQGDATAWVVLSNAGAEVNVAIAEQVGRVGVVLATRGDDLDPPLRTPGAPVIETPDRGRYVSVVRWVVGTVPGPATLVEETGDWQAWDEALERLPLQTAAAQEAERARAQKAFVSLKELGQGRSLLIARDRALGSELEADGPVTRAVAAFGEQTLGAAAARVDAGGPVRFVAGGGCVNCHTDYFSAWAATPHAKAYASLLSRNEQDNAECIACHSTAFGKPGGNAKIDDVSMRTWKAVQCESCHGPGSEHVTTPRSEALHRPTEADCVVCHDAANSPQFDYPSYRARVSCVALMKQ